ncbi:MAG: type II toxin-antitoxin system VapB family antitoxin [Anaerolineae bacterium]|nr:type II toxin-antitoxin system VapB family antitoxin [Anaerolineae bacterium]
MDNHVARSTDQIEKRLRLKLQEEVRELRGKLQWEGNLNEMRESRFL